MILPMPVRALDALMPMNVVFGADWRVAHTGPTLRRLAGGADLVGHPLDDVFECGRERLTKLDTSGLWPINLTLSHGLRPRMRGTVQDLGPGAGQARILNLSLSLTEWERGTAAELNHEDFAPNDLIFDMLYLIEAKMLVEAEATSLIGRLQGAAMTAEELAITDTLTGLQNRRALEQAMDRAIDRSVPFALTHIDLDYFKAVNDTHGHAAGDAVLRHVARVLSEATRTSDTVARVGGDEFVLLLIQQTDQAQIERIARRIISRIEEPVIFDGKECRVSTSLGTTLSTSYPHPDPEQMHSDADKALYASKAAGRATHRFWPPTHADIAEG